LSLGMPWKHKWGSGDIASVILNQVLDGTELSAPSPQTHTQRRQDG